MRQYISAEEYRALGGRMPVDVEPDELNRWLQLATAAIDRMTFGRIVDIERLTPYQAALVRQAVVLQADYQYENYQDTGGMDGAGISGWSVTDISMSYSGTGGARAWLRENNLSPAAYDLLDASGLAWRGV